MTAIEKLQARHQSTISNMKAGDANFKFSFLSVNGIRRKNFIQNLETEQARRIYKTTRGQDINIPAHCWVLQGAEE
jgi:hypothetical protein